MKPAYWEEAKAALAKRDPVLRKLVRAYPGEILKTRGDAFHTLARSIVGQQISVRAADAVWGRFAALAVKVTPEAVLELGEPELRGVGLSRMKVGYLHDLARHFESGEVKPRRWARLDDEAIIEELTRVRGIGRWSAEMFLIFHLLRPDVLPVGDIGLQRAMERHYNGGDEMTKDDMRELAEPWRPWASVATWYLWRSLDPVPVEY